MTRPLTPRQVQITELVTEGLTNRQIGERLFITESTVKVHMRQIFNRTGLKSRLAVAVALIGAAK